MIWPWRKPTFELEASLITDIGCCRETNEDAGQIIRPPNPRLLAEKGMLMVAADGMGGCEGGEIASQVAIQIVGQSYYANGSEPSAALLALHERGEALAHTRGRGRRDRCRIRAKISRLEGCQTALHSP
jgi:serine/threonine protein phosphatase PrpC